MQLSDNAKGASLMIGAMTAFTVNDAFMKTVLAEVPLFQALFLRGVGLSIVLYLMCRAAGQLNSQIAGPDRKLILWRGVAEAGGAALFLSAIIFMPLANVSAVLQALPLTVSLAAAVFLGEALGWRRITAILIGLGGVLLIVQPGGEGFNAYALLAVGAVILVTFRDIAARRLSKDVPSVLVAFITSVIVTTFAGIASIFVDWVVLPANTLLLIGAAILFLCGGYVFSVSAMRVGEISVVAPFRYTSLLVALILGALFFDEWPDQLSLIGAGIVVATGLFTLYREAKARQMAG